MTATLESLTDRAVAWPGLRQPKRTIRVDLSGKRFGRLVAERFAGVDRKGHSHWDCACDCGSRSLVLGRRLLKGTTSSCGCLRREMPTRNKQSLEDRFFRFVDPTDTCWLWTGGHTNGGYGLFRLNQQKSVLVHRWAYGHFVAPIPTGLCVCHACDVRRCVNPTHLWLGTHSDNMRDAVAKGRHVSNLPNASSGTIAREAR